MTANTPSHNDTKPQKELLLDYLLQGHRPTVNEALQELGIYALSQRVGDLIRAGIPVQSQFITTPTGKRIKQYWLEPSYIQSQLSEGKQ